jgi:hypothetical protein
MMQRQFTRLSLERACSVLPVVLLLFSHTPACGAVSVERSGTTSDYFNRQADTWGPPPDCGACQLWSPPEIRDRNTYFCVERLDHGAGFARQVTSAASAAVAPLLLPCSHQRVSHTTHTSASPSSPGITPIHPSSLPHPQV